MSFNYVFGLEASWKILYPGSISYEPAFFCDSCIHSFGSSSSLGSQAYTKKHHSTVSVCGRFETCSIYQSCGRKLSESKLRWMKNISELPSGMVK